MPTIPKWCGFVRFWHWVYHICVNTHRCLIFTVWTIAIAVLHIRLRNWPCPPLAVWIANEVVQKFQKPIVHKGGFLALYPRWVIHVVLCQGCTDMDRLKKTFHVQIGSLGPTRETVQSEISCHGLYSSRPKWTPHTADRANQVLYKLDLAMLASSLPWCLLRSHPGDHEL